MTAIFLANEAETLAFGRSLITKVKVGSIVFLHGDLGAGKTTLVRGFLQGLGYQGTVKSPTYTIVEPYNFEQMNVFHFDLYRVVDPEELELLGFRDYFNNHSICFIEWPERAKKILPTPNLTCYICNEANGRRIELLF